MEPGPPGGTCARSHAHTRVVPRPLSAPTLWPGGPLPRESLSALRATTAGHSPGETPEPERWCPALSRCPRAAQAAHRPTLVRSGSPPPGGRGRRGLLLLSMRGARALERAPPPREGFPAETPRTRRVVRPPGLVAGSWAVGSSLGALASPVLWVTGGTFVCARPWTDATSSFLMPVALTSDSRQGSRCPHPRTLEQRGGGRTPGHSIPLPSNRGRGSRVGACRRRPAARAGGVLGPGRGGLSDGWEDELRGSGRTVTQWRGKTGSAAAQATGGKGREPLGP